MIFSIELWGNAMRSRAAQLAVFFHLALFVCPNASAQLFTSPTDQYNISGLAGGIATGDFNSDGKLDFVFSASGCTTSGCPPGGLGQFRVFIGNGDGTFNAMTAVSTSHAGKVTVGDINGDGKPDILMEDGQVIAVFLGNGDGTFKSETDYSVAESGAVLYFIALGDFNSDGRPDIIVSQGSTGTTTGKIGLLLGNGDGTFQPVKFFPVMDGAFFANPEMLTVGDFNNDGKSDFAVSLDQYTIGVFLGNGDGTFKTPTQYPSGGNGAAAIGITAGDLNSDGKLDLVITNGCATFAATKCTSGSIGVLLGNGDGTFQAMQTYVTGTNAYNVLVGDFNGDGKVDVVASAPCPLSNCNIFAGVLPHGVVYLLLGNGDGSLQTYQTYSSGALAASTLAQGDFNGDGRQDLAVLNEFADNGDLVLPTLGILLAVNPLASIRLSAGSIAFPDQIVGTSSTPPQTVAITNSGNVPVNVASIFVSGGNSSDFSASSDCPGVLTASLSCTASVVFKPSTTTNESASLTISTTAPVDPHIVPMTGSGGDFSIGPASGQPTSATFTAGQSATLNLQVNPIGGFAGSVNLACSGAPPESTCVASASSVNVTGASPAPFMVTVTTTARGLLPPTPLPRPWPRAPLFPIPYLILALLCFLAAALKALGRDRVRPVGRWATAGVFASLVTLSGCGGGGSTGPPPPTGTPAGTYTLTVTGTSQGQNRTVSLTLTVN